MVNYHPAGVRVKLSSNRTTIMVGRASLAHVYMKQSVKGQARGYRFESGMPLFQMDVAWNCVDSPGNQTYQCYCLLVTMTIWHDTYLFNKSSMIMKSNTISFLQLYSIRNTHMCRKLYFSIRLKQQQRKQ